MISRMGSTELAVIVNYLSVTNFPRSILSFVIGQGGKFWWDKDLHLQLRDWSGVFPIDLNSVKKFLDIYKI